MTNQNNAPLSAAALDEIDVALARWDEFVANKDGVGLEAFVDASDIRALIADLKAAWAAYQAQALHHINEMHYERTKTAQLIEGMQLKHIDEIADRDTTIAQLKAQLEALRADERSGE